MLPLLTQVLGRSTPTQFLGPARRNCFIYAALLSWALFSSAAGAVTETGEVKHAIDGDTVVLSSGKHVRLIGINAPERGKDGAPDQPLAAQARARLATLVEGRRVNLVFEREHQDRYGRWLAHIDLLGGGRVEEILLREGLAWMVAIPPNLERLSANLTAENDARAAQRGVWGVSDYAPTPVDRLTAKSTGFRFIEGTVRRHTQRHQVIYFDLAPQVALLVPGEDWDSYFPGKPADLVGRKVIARGWLTESKGRLHMRAQHPAMLTWRD